MGVATITAAFHHLKALEQAQGWWWEGSVSTSYLYAAKWHNLEEAVILQFTLKGIYVFLNENYWDHSKLNCFLCLKA